MDRLPTASNAASARGHRTWRGVVAWLALVLLSSCGGQPFFGCLDCLVKDTTFYNATYLSVAPSSVAVAPGQAASAPVTLIYDTSQHDVLDRPYSLDNVSVVQPAHAGVTIADANVPCVVPASLGPRLPAGHVCRTYTLTVTAEAIAAGTRDVVVSAQWAGLEGQSGPTVIERLGHFSVTLAGPPGPPPAPDFQIAVGAVPGGAYATVATLPVSINRVGGFVEAVTLEYFPLSSGIGGGFIAEPVPTDRRSLQLQIPAHFAVGGRVDPRVKATAAGGQTRTLDFPLFIEPLFRLELQPAAASLTTAMPLRVEVGLTPGNPFRTGSLGPVELSLVPPPLPPFPEPPLPALPPGVTHQFLSDATPVGPVLPILKVWRTLQLVTNGVSNVTGPLTIRATALGLPADIYGTRPFVDVTLDLTVVEGLSWQFVGNNLTYGTREADIIGIGLQSDNRTAFAWMEGPGGKNVYMRRFDGTTFAPSPPRVDRGFGLVAPPLTVPGGIDEASFALTASDAGQVAFIYGGGTALALGRAERAATEWTVGPALVVGDPADPATTRARSPRVLTGPAADAVVVSYIREANAQTTTGGVLHVLRTFGNGVLSPLPTTLPGGSLNASPTGSVVRHSNAMALRADGNPWVAWIEEPTAAGQPLRLYVRAYDGNDWGPAIAVPTVAAPVGASVQILVEPSGRVIVAWLVGSPAQLRLARYDPASQVWSQLDNTDTGRGTLNVTASFSAADVHLARQPDGRLLATWTEGGADQRVWIKRLESNGRWAVVGTTVSQFDRYAKTPRIVSDANNRLYVAWATYAAGQNPGTFLPYAEIDVAQWIFP